MNVLIYDVDFQSSGNKYPIQKAFETLGHKADMFDWRTFLFSYKKSSLINSLKDRFLFWVNATKINKAFKTKLTTGDYDFVLVVRGDHLWPDTIDFAKKHAKIVANWSSDDLFNKVMNTKFILKSFSKYDVHFSPRTHLREEYLQKGAKSFEVINWYYRPELAITKGQAGNFRYISDISFIGSWSKRRNEILRSLKDLNLKLCGWGWRKKLNSGEFKNWEINEHIKMTDMADLFSTTKININIFTIENRDRVNPRSYDIAASSGFQISERSDELLEVFVEGVDLVCFSTPEELQSKVTYYLQNDALRERIALAGYKKIVGGKNSLQDRVDEIAQIIQKKYLN